jgi:hypothetical protein
MTGKKETTESKLRRLIPECLPIERVWKFERKARDYRRMYVKLAESIRLGTFSKDDVNYASLERMRSKQKTHRNMIELDLDFIRNTTSDVFKLNHK